MSDTSQTTSLARRFENPASPAMQALFASEWGRSDPAYLRGLDRHMSDLPERRRQWLVGVADRLEAGGYGSVAEVPAERFDEVVQLY